MNVDVIWSKVLEQIKSELNSLSYEAWFSETKLHKLDNGKAYIIVPMEIHKKHILNNYSDIVIDNLNSLTGTNYEIYLLSPDEIEEEEEKEKVIENNETPVQINENINNNLNPRYTFYNFIVGNSNKFAQASALSVAENPGLLYNPLFLYGNSGLGKTHLMHAIGNYIVENSNKRVLYVTSEQFRQDFVKANRKDEEGTNFNYVDFFKLSFIIRIID